MAVRSVRRTEAAISRLLDRSELLVPTIEAPPYTPPLFTPHLEGKTWLTPRYVVGFSTLSSQNLFIIEGEMDRVVWTRLVGEPLKTQPGSPMPKPFDLLSLP